MLKARTNMASYNELQFDWEIFLENIRGSRNGTTVGECNNLFEEKKKNVGFILMIDAKTFLSCERPLPKQLNDITP